MFAEPCHSGRIFLRVGTTPPGCHSGRIFLGVERIYVLQEDPYRMTNEVFLPARRKILTG